MSALTLLALVATLSALLTTTLPLLQVRKMWRERDGYALALPWACFPAANAAVWTAYSFALGNIPLETTNGVYLVVSVLLAAATLVLRHRHPRRTADVRALAVAGDRRDRAFEAA